MQKFKDSLPHFFFYFFYFKLANLGKHLEYILEVHVIVLFYKHYGSNEFS